MRLLYIFYSKKLNKNQNKASFIQVISMCKAFSEKKDIECILAIPDHLADNFDGNYPFKVMYYTPWIREPRINRFLNYYAVKKIIRLVDPDIIFSRDPVLLLPAKSGKFQLIYEAHNSLLHNGNEWINKLLKKTIKRISRRKNFSLFVAISQALSDFWIKEGIQEEKVIALHDGFSEKMFRELIPNEKARRELGLPISRKIALYAGSLYSDRDIGQIVNLADQFPEILFIILGGPDAAAEELKKELITKRINNLLLTGYLPHEQVPLYLFASDILLALWSDKVKTINYCSPLKVFEYMASGRTIIAHGFPTILEVLENRKNALIADPNDFTSLKNCMREIIEGRNPGTLGNNARKLAFTKYSWDKRVNEILRKIGTQSMDYFIEWHLNEQKFNKQLPLISKKFGINNYQEIKFYSQQDEDKYLIQYLLDKKITDGVFLEVGACDGILYSNTKTLEDSFGFSGILIEPQKHYYNKLIINRPNCECYNYAVSDKNTNSVKFNELNAEGRIVDIFFIPKNFKDIKSSISIKKIKKLFKNKKVQVPNIRMRDLLNKTKFKYIDFMFIDVEGGELSLLKSIDFNFPIYCIIIEAHSSQENKNKRVRTFLTHQGFTFKERQRGNEVWINTSYFRKNLFHS